MKDVKSVIGGANDGDSLEDRVILVDKPAGISSFGVVAKVRGRLRAEFGHKVKVGHTGTLDPFATGLLILLTGKMTKKSGEFLKLDKEYVATLKLGYISSTGDPEGEIRSYSDESVAEQIQSCSNKGGPEPGKARSSAGRPWRRAGRTRPELNMIESVLHSFVGKIEQAPPRYSAIKINGERAYRLARKGVEFETPIREVEIYEIEILRYEWPELEIRCKVSSGTYIRTLAEDIGVRLGVGAYLTALRRTQVGEYKVQDAISLDEFGKMGLGEFSKIV